MSRRPRRMKAGLGREKIMWIIELNVAGYRFTREVPDLKRRSFRFSPRNMHWPVSRHSHAA
ncbi:hypothetical protein NJB14197_02300 [Mycobacterium montefiorense]|uniref:Uncharacterized protein n=1 Tax=Mycobacterium montefiorense TaxID=154654 RepID=A0ABQ0NMC7_9MYCO|nr:hypothetical protein MmonteBS_24090 [Mycobacterium montefiorense]GKU33813.1 hypothetical protein NJB14191_11600 [Mycobacterium montefiorense]GKU42990.1 hypothetical protein NJB14192_49730 [Mycobacterium montefiorense]GKU45422.1 hypothetical protein NJB14194_20440 [Mycobacterium montefiorense]GKU49285.1 hypothetical protein NJB14195_05320 [Mycobacterium montefiorense]